MGFRTFVFSFAYLSDFHTTNNRFKLKYNIYSIAEMELLVLVQNSLYVVVYLGAKFEFPKVLILIF